MYISNLFITLTNVINKEEYVGKIFHINKYKYNDEITIEERHYEWYCTTERVINGGLCYPKYRETYTEIVGVSKKTNKVVTHKHSTYTDLFDELKKLNQC